MAAPNIVNITTLTGKTTYVNLTTTGSTSILSNASGSNRVYKINSLFVSNIDTANVNCIDTIYSFKAFTRYSFWIHQTINKLIN